MSVFQLHDWWTTKVGDNEEFDQHCFGVGNIDNSLPPSNKIVIGSLDGILRIYHPTKPNYRVEDLVMEEDLKRPILQLAVGRFIPSNDTLAVAILHPRELVVYEVLPQAVKDDRVSYYSLRRLYFHDLGVDGKHFTAYNMTFGPFGGVRGKDMIMVQSMDGKLQVFEQSAHAFTRQLTDCLIPGPIVYVPRLDAFVTVTYAGFAQCYRFQVLASSIGDLSEGKTESKSESKSGLKSVKSSVVEWSTNLGEQCRQIILGNFSLVGPVGGDSVNYRNSSNHASELLMVCEKSLFLLKTETGGIIQQRKLDRADASCVCIVPYIAELPNSNTAIAHNFLLAYEDATVQVFSGFQLIWAAKLTAVPVHLSVATFAGLKGLITSIDQNGYLSVNFLGTKPAIQPILSQVRDLDYDKIDEEHRSLLQIIRDSQSDTKINQVDKLLIKSQVPRTFDLENNTYNHLVTHSNSSEISDNFANFIPVFPSTSASAHHSSTNDSVIRCTIRFYLTYTHEKPATNVTLSLATSDNLFIHPRNIHVPKVTGLRTTPLIVKVSIYATKASLPTSLDLHVSASYTSHKNDPQITSHTISLPLYLICRPKPPSKNALYKLTIDTEASAIPLTELFADLLYSYQEAGMEVTEMLGSNAMQAMGFQHFNSTIINTSVTSSGLSSTLNPSLVSILVSKNAGRYRVQSDSYSLMYNILSELERRLTAKISESQSTAPAVVRFNEGLPLEEFFALLQSHLAHRIALLQQTAKLNDASQQYRLIEKRLLVRFKDRNPTPLHGLDVILKETYTLIMKIADEIEDTQRKIVQYSNEIKCFSKLLCLLIAMKYQLSFPERQALMCHLCPEIRDGVDQGWEESVTASLQSLNRAISSKVSKESGVSSASTEMEMPKNVDLLKRLFLQLIERLDKGARLDSIVPPTVGK